MRSWIVLLLAGIVLRMTLKMAMPRQNRQWRNTPHQLFSDYGKTSIQELPLLIQDRHFLAVYEIFFSSTILEFVSPM